MPTAKPKPKPRKRSERAIRRCLGSCGQDFNSQHKGNRICPDCKRHEGDRGPLATFMKANPNA